MHLLGNHTSPFVRQVRIAAAIKGLAGRIPLQIVDTNPPGNAELVHSNPLGKIPVLVLDDGTRLYDSRVIAEAIDSLTAEPRLFPPSGPARFEMLTRVALADGIKEAAVLVFYEGRLRSEAQRSADWLARQQGKIDAALAHLEGNVPDWSPAPDYGHVSLAAALGYLDFRQEGSWRASHPRLVDWRDHFAAAIPAFAETAPPPG
ncbi:MAG: glutathione S-transferase N-terminal domain-containing protein [Pseudomonadota bacterium]